MSLERRRTSEGAEIKRGVFRPGEVVVANMGEMLRRVKEYVEKNGAFLR